MLKVRPFVKDRDEANFVRIFNAVFEDYEDMRSMTLEEMKNIEESPSFNADGIFIADWNGQTAGMINAYVDKLREEQKGFIQSLGVIPEFRGGGIAKKLVEKALESLTQRGMKTVETVAQSDRAGCVHIFESFGFKQIRATSMMKRSLNDFSADVGKNEEISLKKMLLSDENEVTLLNSLNNEVFKEHYNYRPKPLEETRYMLFELPWFQEQAVFFAVLNGESVGFVITGIDKGLNEEKHVYWGWILDIGVLKPHRRKGVGTSLMNNGMNLLKAQGMNEALLYVDDMNPTKAIKLYEKLGFKILRKFIVYQKSLA